MILELQDAVVVSRKGMPLMAMCPMCLSAWEITVWASEGQIRVKRRKRGSLERELVVNSVDGQPADFGLVKPDVVKTDYAKEG